MDRVSRDVAWCFDRAREQRVFSSSTQRLLLQYQIYSFNGPESLRNYPANNIHTRNVIFAASTPSRLLATEHCSLTETTSIIASSFSTGTTHCTYIGFGKSVAHDCNSGREHKESGRLRRRNVRLSSQLAFVQDVLLNQR
jgi:hypothetical protein